jgi:hypothetical protein
MKKSQLRKIIRESIKEVLTEQTEPPVGSLIYTPKLKTCYKNPTPQGAWTQSVINSWGPVGVVGGCLGGTSGQSHVVYLHDGNPLSPGDIGKSYDWATSVHSGQSNNFANTYGPGMMFSTIHDVCLVNYVPNPGNPPVFHSSFSTSCPSTQTQAWEPIGVGQEDPKKCKHCCLPHLPEDPSNIAYSPIPPDCKCQPGDIKIDCSTFLPIP